MIGVILFQKMTIKLSFFNLLVVVEIRVKNMSREKGDFAEKKAISFLQDLDFEIIETNFYAKKLGEIDIIAKKNSIYHFCEVKSAVDYETAINNLTNSKLAKIKRSIDYYIQTKKLDIAYCIDAIIITDETIDFIENITI